MDKETVRQQSNHLMSLQEKEAFVEIIPRLPWLYEPILEALEPYAATASSLVDIGCGSGQLLKLIQKRYQHLQLTGVDPDAFMIEKAKELQVTTYQLPAEEYQAESDIIISNLALHHFHDPIAVVKRLAALAKDVLIISDQLRPATDSELEQRLKRRGEFIGARDVPYYRQSSREAILEAYSKPELRELLTKVGVDHEITFLDTDYYERFVVVFR